MATVNTLEPAAPRDGCCVLTRPWSELGPFTCGNCGKTTRPMTPDELRRVLLAIRGALGGDEGTREPGLVADAPAPPPPKPCAQRHPDGDRWCYLPEGHEGPHDAPAPSALPASDHGPHGARRTAP